jgi:hypothetical protein
MNAGSDYTSQIQNPADAKTLGGRVAQQLTSLKAAILGCYHTQHNADDTHSTITATGPISERGRSTPIGAWINEPFNAGDFTITGAGNSIVVPAPAAAGNIAPISYMLVGTTLFCNVFATGVTLTVPTPITIFRVQIPGNYLLAVAQGGSFNIRLYTPPAYLLNSGIQRQTHLFITPGDRSGIFVERTDGSNLATDGAFEFGFQTFFEIVP